jgi:hypothetical protein
LSCQVNFFSDAVDTEVLHDWLLGELSDWLFIRCDRGTRDALTPVRITALRERAVGSMGFLIASEDIGALEMSPRSGKQDEFVIQPRLNPVLEYSPSRMLDNGRTCHVGRFYWAFDCEVGDATEKKVSKVMRWVRSNTKPIPGYSGFRIFPHASQSVEFLKFWVIDPIRNPLNDRGEETSTVA